MPPLTTDEPTRDSPAKVPEIQASPNLPLSRTHALRGYAPPTLRVEYAIPPPAAILCLVFVPPRVITLKAHVQRPAWSIRPAKNSYPGSAGYALHKRLRGSTDFGELSRTELAEVLACNQPTNQPTDQPISKPAEVPNLRPLIMRTDNQKTAFGSFVPTRAEIPPSAGCPFLKYCPCIRGARFRCNIRNYLETQQHTPTRLAACPRPTTSKTIPFRSDFSRFFMDKLPPRRLPPIADRPPTANSCEKSLTRLFLTLHHTSHARRSFA
jgi:hypothetical protein